MTKININSIADDLMFIENTSKPVVLKTNTMTPSSDYYTDDQFYQIDESLARKYEALVAEIARYSMMTENLHDLHNETDRLNLFAKLSFGLRKSGEAKAWVSFYKNVAYAQKKEAEGVAALDDFSDYLSMKAADGKDVKATDKTRDLYVTTNKGVIAAQRKLAMLDAMDEMISIYKLQFIQGISTIKAMVYGNRDSQQLSTMDNKDAF